MEEYIRGLNLSQLRELWDAQDDLLLEHEKTFDDFYQELMKGHDSNDKELTYIVESYLTSTGIHVSIQKNSRLKVKQEQRN